MQLVAHLQFAPAIAESNNCKRATKLAQERTEYK